MIQFNCCFSQESKLEMIEANVEFFIKKYYDESNYIPTNELFEALIKENSSKNELFVYFFHTKTFTSLYPDHYLCARKGNVVLLYLLDSINYYRDSTFKANFLHHPEIMKFIRDHDEKEGNFGLRVTRFVINYKNKEIAISDYKEGNELNYWGWTLYADTNRKINFQDILNIRYPTDKE